jgi:hypothetical protein
MVAGSAKRRGRVRANRIEIGQTGTRRTLAGALHYRDPMSPSGTS